MQHFLWLDFVRAKELMNLVLMQPLKFLCCVTEKWIWGSFKHEASMWNWCDACKHFSFRLMLNACLRGFSFFFVMYYIQAIQRAAQWLSKEAWSLLHFLRLYINVILNSAQMDLVKPMWRASTPWLFRLLHRPQEGSYWHFASVSTDMLCSIFIFSSVISAREETKILNYTQIEIDAKIRRFQLKLRCPK